MGEETHNLLSIGRLQAPIDNPLIQLILLIPSNNSPLLNQFFHIILNSTGNLTLETEDNQGNLKFVVPQTDPQGRNIFCFP